MSTEPWQKMSIPMKFSETWQSMKGRELPLYGCPWTDSVLLQISEVQKNPEGWSRRERLTPEAARRGQIMLWFILENKLIPLTTGQVLTWLD